MASAEISTSSSQISTVASDEATKKSVDEAFLNKMKSLVERLRLENSTLKKSLDVERSGVRALKAQNEANLRQLKAESKKKEEALEKQLRSIAKPEKLHIQSGSLAEVKKLCTEILSLKASNKCLQDKLKVAVSAERERAAELRACAERQATHELAARKDARAQVHKLLEEIKSKERVIAQLKRNSQPAGSQDNDQTQRMECRASEQGPKLRFEQGKEKTNRDNLKTDIRHRKETFYRDPTSDGDSAVSSAPTSLSPQPHSDMWSCGQCRSAQERAEAAAREGARLADALRDARDQLELMEFRLLELEDAAPDKGARDNLTDSDSGCVSPGSRIKDSASPEFRRMDSGYKSPTVQPTSPCNPRRMLQTPVQDEYTAKIQQLEEYPGRCHPSVLAEILDKTCAYSDTSDSLKSNPVKEHLEQMILNAGSVEDRTCLEQVLMLLYNLQALSSSVSEDECFQVKPKKICDLKALSKLDGEIPFYKSQKVIATVTPYSQQSNRDRNYKCDSLESLCSDEPKKSNHSILQESGIFEGVETECKTTQTEVYDSLEYSGDLNTEIQRLNSIREKLEKKAVSRSLSSKLQSDDGEGLECRCVKLGKKHKQYYERRLKFLEGKISIYEAARDVKEAKLAQRLQKEFILETTIQELETQLSTLQDKYDQLEEDFCEIEEIENDTRLHWQQLEMEYELATAQLHDMSAAREVSAAAATRLAGELRAREERLRTRAARLAERLLLLERALPALIVWHVLEALQADRGTAPAQSALTSRLGSLANGTPKSAIQQLRSEAQADRESNECTAVVVWDGISSPGSPDLERRIVELLDEKEAIEVQALKQRDDLEARIAELRQQADEEAVRAQRQQAEVNDRIKELEEQLEQQRKLENTPADPEMGAQLENLVQAETEMKGRIQELERRETAYLEMLTQADDMWAEMEGGYKQRIQDAERAEAQMIEKMQQLEMERNKWKNCCVPLKQQLRDLEESETNLRVALEKAERDAKGLKSQNCLLVSKISHVEAELSNSQIAFKELSSKFKVEMESFRQKTNQLAEELKAQKEITKETESVCQADLDKVRKELNRCCKNAMDLDVTNSELREEVESLESQLALMQKTVSQCKRKCEEKVKTLSYELSLKTEELEELRSETMRQSLRATKEKMNADRTEYIDDGGYTLCTAVPKKVSDFGRMHHSLSFITSEARCSCPSMRSQLVGSLIEDLFDRMHSTADDDLVKLCVELLPHTKSPVEPEIKAKINNYLLMAISKELVRSIGDADAKTDTEEWQRAVSCMTYTVPCGSVGGAGGAGGAGVAGGGEGVARGAARLGSVACACAAARLCASRPDLADCVKTCQEEVLEHSDVKIMEEQLANAIESIVNCPSCALGTNAIVWSTDV